MALPGVEKECPLMVDDYYFVRKEKSSLAESELTIDDGQVPKTGDYGSER